MMHTPHTQARMYGGVIACYMWSIYLCDYHRLDLWMSVVCIVLGACLLWHLYPSSSQQSWTLKNENMSTRCPQQGQTMCQGLQHRQQQQSTFFNSQPVSSISAAEVPSSESSSVPLSMPITLSILAQECNAVEGHLFDQDNIVLQLAVHTEERNSVYRDWTQRNAVDSQHENKVERKKIPRQNQYAWMVFATHSLVGLGYLSVVGTTLLADWIGTTKAVRGLMILSVIICNGLLARWWSIGHSGSLNSQPQQGEVKDGRPDMDKTTMGGLADPDPQPKLAEKQHQLLPISGPCEQFLQQQQMKDGQEIVKHHYTTYRPAVALDLEPSSLSTVDYIRQEMRVWALSLYFLLPEAVPRPVYSLYERKGEELGPCKGFGYDRFDNEPLMNDTNNDRYDDTPTIASAISNHGNYERRERYANTNSTVSGRAVRKRPVAHLSTLGPQNRRVVSETASQPIESTLVRLARLTMDSERLGNIFNYYRRQHAASTSSTSGSGRSGSASDCAGTISGTDSSEQTPDIAFVVRSSTLPTVRVGLYGTTEKRLWSSTGLIFVTTAPMTLRSTTTVPEDEEIDEDLVMVNHVDDDQDEVLTTANCSD